MSYIFGNYKISSIVENKIKSKKRKIRVYKEKEKWILAITYLL